MVVEGTVKLKVWISQETVKQLGNGEKGKAGDIPSTGMFGKGWKEREEHSLLEAEPGTVIPASSGCRSRSTPLFI